MNEGQDLGDAVPKPLRCVVSRRIGDLPPPLDSHKFFWGWGAFLAGTSFVIDRPPTHFFVKKKFILVGGAETATQKASSGFCAETPVRRSAETRDKVSRPCPTTQRF